jgi:hypothetical protein
MKIEFYEYGKYFTSEGVSDFCVLTYSNKKYIDKNSDIKPQEMYERLYFRDNTDFSKQKGAVSIAFIPTHPQTWSLFHIQSRREDERSDLQDGQTDIIRRPYYQIRCSFISPKELITDYRTGMSPLIGIVFGGEYPLKNVPNLSDYREKEIYAPPPEILCATTGSTSFLYQMSNKYNDILFSIAKAIIESDNLQTVFVVCHNKLTLHQRLIFAEDIERLVYWKKRKWVSFALDVVVAPNNKIKLQFCNILEEVLTFMEVGSEVFDLNSENNLIEKDQGLNRVFQIINSLGFSVEQKWEKFNDLFFNQLPLVGDLNIAFISNPVEKILYLLKLSKDTLNLDVQDDNEAIVNCMSSYCLELANPQRKSLIRELGVLDSNNAFTTDSIFKTQFESFFRGYLSSAPIDYDFRIDFSFLKKLIPRLTQDKALGYIVNRDIDRTPIDSYWSAALNIDLNEKKVINLFCVIINSCFEDKTMLYGITYADIDQLDFLSKKNKGARKLLSKLINDQLQFPFSEFDLAINFPKKILVRMNDEQVVPPLLISLLNDALWMSYRDTYFRQALVGNDVQNLIKNFRKRNIDEKEYKILFSWADLPDLDEREERIFEFLRKLKEISRDHEAFVNGSINANDEILERMAGEFVIFLREIVRKENLSLSLNNAMQELEDDILKIIQKNNLNISPLELLNSLRFCLDQIIEKASVFDKVRALKFLVPFMYRISELKVFSRQRKNKFFFKTNPRMKFLHWLLYDFYPRFMLALQTDSMHSEDTLILTNKGNGRFDNVLNINIDNLENANTPDNISLWLVYSYAKLHGWHIHPDIEKKCETNSYANPFMNIKKFCDYGKVLWISYLT